MPLEIHSRVGFNGGTLTRWGSQLNKRKTSDPGLATESKRVRRRAFYSSIKFCRFQTQVVRTRLLKPLYGVRPPGAHHTTHLGLL
ncbi:MAG: hypothetical protein RLZZ435_2505 [Cyanobacteriota bacterium]|jgi:hypothetical protein